MALETGYLPSMRVQILQSSAVTMTRPHPLADIRNLYRAQEEG